MTTSRSRVVERAVRLAMMFRMFQEGGCYSTRELAERFGVVSATISADLNVLQADMAMPLERIYEVRYRKVAES